MYLRGISPSLLNSFSGSGGTDEVNLKVVEVELPPDSRFTQLLFVPFAGGAVSSLYSLARAQRSKSVQH